MKNRYEIITHSWESGLDEKQCTDSLKAACQLVYVYLTEGIRHTGESYYDSAAIYDYKTQKVAAVYNGFDQERYISEPNRNSNAQQYWIARPNHV